MAAPPRILAELTSCLADLSQLAAAETAHEVVAATTFRAVAQLLKQEGAADLEAIRPQGLPKVARPLPGARFSGVAEGQPWVGLAHLEESLRSPSGRRSMAPQLSILPEAEAEAPAAEDMLAAKGPKSDIQLRESCTPDSEASTRCQTAEKGSTRCSTAEKVNKLEVNLPVLPPVPQAVKKKKSKVSCRSQSMDVPILMLSAIYTRPRRPRRRH